MDELREAVRLRELGTPEACALLAAMSDGAPGDTRIAYQAAWAHDVLGLEAEAVAYYERALGGPDLAPFERHGAFLGLGSTLRVLGRFDDALRTLARGLAEFPDDAALRTFLAMALYNSGEPRAAVRLLLKVTAETSADHRVRKYRRAIAHYADHLDETP